MFAMQACKPKQVDQDSLGIVAVENIQLSFDLAWESASEEQKEFSNGGLSSQSENASALRIDKKKEPYYKSLVSSQGNFFVIKDLKGLNNFAQKHQDRLLLTENYHFIWDTLNTEKRLFLVNREQVHYLEAETLLKSKSTDESIQYTVSMTPRNRVKLSTFFAQNIGKGLLLVDKDGFVAGAEKMSKLEDGNLMFEQ